MLNVRGIRPGRAAAGCSAAARAAAKFEDLVKGSTDENGMRISTSCFALIRAASALAASAALLATGCGRGPVPGDFLPTPAGGTITFEFFVQGHIAPTEGDYIIAINSDIDANTDVNPNETPGEPTVQEAQVGSFTHWDQRFVYGFDTQNSPGMFLYFFKAVGTTGGTTTITWVPIFLNPNQYVFVPSSSVGTGTNNAFSITLPISGLSRRSIPKGPSPAPSPTPTPAPATQIYVNFITTDNSTPPIPQDQLGCCSLSTTGYTLLIPLGQAATFQSALTTPPNKTGPSNPDLWITGGEIIVSPSM